MGLLFRSIIGIPLLVIVIAVIIGLFEDNGDLNALTRPNHLGPIQDRSPKNTREFGRYKKPLASIDYSWVSSSKFFNFTAFKHWDFKSISTQRYFIVAAIGNFNYIANAFVYVIDRQTSPPKIYQYSAKSVLAMAITEQATTSIEGCTHFYRSSSEFIRLCYNPQEKRYRIEANVPMENGVQISFDSYLEYSSENFESLALLYPVTTNRPAYTHKIAGLPAQGKIRIGENNEENFDNGLGSVDWTMGYPARICRWKW